MKVLNFDRKLPTLTYRRLRGDLIEIYKIVTPGPDKYDPQVCADFLKLRGESVTRGHKSKLFKIRPDHNLRARSFPHRCVDVWNTLSQHVVDANKVITFESRLDRFLASQPMKFDYLAEFKFPGTGRTNNSVLDDLMPEVS